MGADELFRRTDGGGHTVSADTSDAPQDTAALSAIFAEIVGERIEQDKQWGGPEHDDQHNLFAWREFIAYRIDRMKTYDHSPEGIANCRRRLVQIAALAVAATQSLDRLQQAVAAEAAGEAPDA